MPHNPRCRITAAMITTVLTLAGSWVAKADAPENTLYVLSNNPGAGQNAVLGFHRNRDGSLTPLPGSPFLTGGTGFAVPLTAPPGPFDGQNILAADPQNGVILVPNGGSDSISSLRMRRDGALVPVEGSPFAVTGNTPEALGLRGRTLIVVNNATDPNQAASGVGPSYVTAHVDEHGQVRQLPFSTVSLAAGSVPSQALPWRDTPVVFTNEFGAATVSEYFMDHAGYLHLIETQPAPVVAGATAPGNPLGQDLNPAAPYLYVGLPGAAQVAVYRLGEFSETFVRTVPTTSGTAASPAGTGGGPCWVRVSKDGRYLYSDNTGGHSISVYDLRDPSNPVAIQTVVMRNVNGATFDFNLSPDGKFMYVVEGATAASEAAAPGSGNQLHVLGVNKTTGLVNEISASPVNLGVSGHRVEGVLVF